MLLKLQQSDLAPNLSGVSRDILRLLQAIAEDEDADPGELLKNAWPAAHGRPKADALRRVLELPVPQREALALAVEADVGFDAHLDADDFAFCFSDLDPATRDAAKALLVSMYDGVLSRKGFEGGDSSALITRASLEEGFWRTNPDLAVCPACLLEILERQIDGKTAVHLDHYLPKALYPALAIHPSNLVPMCGVCNSVVKGQRDPLRDEQGTRQTLLNIWFPYHRPGLSELTVNFHPRNSVTTLVSMNGAPGNAAAARRARAFDLLFALTGRWSSHLHVVHKYLINEVKGRIDEPTADSVRDELRMIASIRARGIKSGGFLTAAYGNWVAEHPPALAAFLQDVVGTTASP